MTPQGDEATPTDSQAGMTVSTAVAARIREARKRRGWSAGELAERCARAGFPMSKAVLANIESGRPGPDGARRRDVTVDELLAFASVLDVAPVFLMGLPEGSAGVKITASTAVSDQDQLLMWIRGDQPLPGADSRLYFTAALEQMPMLDSTRVIEELRRAVLQDRAKDLVGQFRGETDRVTSQARDQVQRIIADAGAAVATGASSEELFALLKSANDRLGNGE